jgi:hypothetical protein
MHLAKLIRKIRMISLSIDNQIARVHVMLFSGVVHWFLSVEKIFQPPADELELKERCLEDF